MARKIVVIGGGVTGASVAWNLARRDAGDITLIERDRLGSGTTWHSAGNITWIPGNEHILTLFDDLETVAREAEQETGWLWTGRLFLARSDSTLEHFRTMSQAADALRFDHAWLDPAQAAERHPWLEGDHLAGAWFNSKSGRVNPADLTAAHARAARRRGVTIIENCAATGLDIRNGRLSAVRSAAQDFDADVAIVCGGLWSRRFLSQLGVLLPQWGCQHFYLIARGPSRLDRTTPSFVCPDDLIYGREEVGDMLLGCFDKNALTLDGSHGAPPDDFSFSLLEENWDKVAPYVERAAEHFPCLGEAEIRRFVNGPESFTPDGEPLIGAYGSIDGLFVASAMNSGGVTYSALSGHLIADAVTDAAEPAFDPAPYDPNRFSDRACNEDWLRECASGIVSGHYRDRFEA